MLDQCWNSRKFQVGFQSMLLNMFINNLDEGIESFPIKFADDKKLGVLVDTLEKINIQKDLDRLENWPLDNHITLNKDK